MSIQFGDEYRVMWEVKKPGQAVHDVPFMRLCDIGLWSNWSYANMVAFKIMWRSRRHNNQWRTKYIQRAARHCFVANCTAPGALLEYSLGVGLYCFFVRNRFPNAQPWSADFGAARIATYNVGSFLQRIIVAQFAASADNNLTGPVYSTDVPRLQMERLGLKNVPAGFKGITWGWLSDPSRWKEGNVGTPKETHGYKKRAKCDYCLLSAESKYAGMHTDTNICKQVPNSRMREPCAKIGRPCSWTDLPSLFGVDTWLQQIKEARGNYTEGALHKAAVKALISQREAKGTVEVYEIDSKSGRVVTEQAQLQQEQTSSRRIGRRDLSSADQGVYDSFEQTAMGIITPIYNMNRSTQAYQTGMNQLVTLVSSVATRTDISDSVRACLNYFIERDIRPFMINGRIPLRGG